MAFGTAAERLAFILELDTRSGEAALRRFGDTADRELGRADNRLDRIGGQMQVAGGGAVVFAGVAGRALFGFARASEDANRSQLELQNTLDNQPQLAGESTAAFNDLAQAIENKTAADGDQIVSAMAMLGTFRLTGEEIRGVTPLVVDYARKFGVDLITAAIQVGKALDGQSGALRRNGVSIDEALFATDRYAAVTQALREQVGGFAEAEGATFAGQIERLKHQIGALAEGVGAGAVDAFGDFADAGSRVVEMLAGSGAHTQAAVGRFAAYGTAAVGAVGATSFLAGSLLKMRDRFTNSAEAVQAGAGKLNAFGKVAGTLGVAGAVVGLAVGMKELYDASNRLTFSLDDLRAATDDQLNATIAMFPMLDAWGVSTKQFAEDLANQSIPQAERFAEALERNGQSGQIFRDAIDEARGTHQRAAADSAAHTEALDEQADALDGNTEATEDNDEAVRRVTERYERFRRKVQEVTDAQRELTGQQLSVEEALLDVADAIDQYTATNADAEATDRDRQRAQIDLQRSWMEYGETVRDAAETAERASGNTTTAAEEASRRQIEALLRVAATLSPDSDLYRWLTGYIDQLNVIPAEVETTVRIRQIMESEDRRDATIAANREADRRNVTGSPSFPIAQPKSVVINNYGLTYPELSSQIERDVLWGTTAN